jgi:hypothetical protein
MLPESSSLVAIERRTYAYRPDYLSKATGFVSRRDGPRRAPIVHVRPSTSEL